VYIWGKGDMVPRKKPVLWQRKKINIPDILISYLQKISK